MSSQNVETVILHYDSDDRRGNPEMISGLLGVNVKVYTSHEKIGTWRAAKHAMAKMDEESTHVLVLENDVVPCVNMHAAATRIAGIIPEEVISFFAGAPVARRAYAEGRHLFRQDGSTSGQALMIPACLIPGVRQWGKDHDHEILRAEHAGLDFRVIGYLMSIGKTPIHTAPCLVEHIGTKSTMGNRFRGPGWSKFAACFLGLDFDAMTIDWEAAAEKLRAADSRRSFKPRELNKLREKRERQQRGK
jgi:hypothetical protein